MNNMSKIALTLFAAAIISSAPALAAETAPATQQPSLTDALKSKAAGVVDQAQQKADSAASQLKNTLGVKEDSKGAGLVDKAQKKADCAADSLKQKLGAKSGQEEVVNVEQQTVTVETPDGIAQETVTTVTPEGQVPANPADAATKALQDAGEKAVQDATKKAAEDAAKNLLQKAVTPGAK